MYPRSPNLLLLSCLDLWIENYSGIARIPCDSTAFLFYDSVTDCGQLADCLKVGRRDISMFIVWSDYTRDARIIYSSPDYFKTYSYRPSTFANVN